MMKILKIKLRFMVVEGIVIISRRVGYHQSLSFQQVIDIFSFYLGQLLLLRVTHILGPRAIEGMMDEFEIPRETLREIYGRLLRGVYKSLLVVG
jgi:hypothetical protein